MFLEWEIILIISNLDEGCRGIARNFFQRGTKRGLGTEVPQQGPGAEPWWGSGGEASRS